MVKEKILIQKGDYSQHNKKYESNEGQEGEKGEKEG